MPVIDVRDLRKTYGAIAAVDGLSFDVDAGEVYALFGENGCGQVDDRRDSRGASVCHLRIRRGARR